MNAMGSFEATPQERSADVRPGHPDGGKPRLRSPRAPPRVVPENLRPSGRRPEHAREQLQGRRLAGAVGPELAEDLAWLYLQIEVAQGDPVAVCLCQPLGPHDRCLGHGPTMSRGLHM